MINNEDLVDLGEFYCVVIDVDRLSTIEHEEIPAEERAPFATRAIARTMR
jgi:hypothetical protein